LIQQALTFIESMLPYYYQDKEILFFDNEELKNFGEDEYSAFNRYLNKFRFKNQDRGEELAFYVYHLIEGSREPHVDWINLRNHALRYYYPVNNNQGDKLEIKSKYIRNNRIGNIVLDDFRTKVVPLLQSHRTLKTIRNVFNHGNSNYRVSMKRLG